VASSRQCPEQKRETFGGTIDNLSKRTLWIGSVGLANERETRVASGERTRELVFLYLYLTSLFSRLTYDFRTLHTSYFARTARTCICDTLVASYRSPRLIFIEGLISKNRTLSFRVSLASRANHLLNAIPSFRLLFFFPRFSSRTIFLFRGNSPTPREQFDLFRIDLLALSLTNHRHGDHKSAHI